jgi:hypothetical protein
MAEFGDFSATMEEYLNFLQRILEDGDDDSGLNAEHLLWTLLSASTSSHQDRVWKMSRFVGVVKRSSQMWSVIENALRRFLRLPEGAEDFDSVVREWHHKRFSLEAKSLTEILDPSTVVPTQVSRAAGVNMTLCSIHSESELHLIQYGPALTPLVRFLTVSPANAGRQTITFPCVTVWTLRRVYKMF